MIMLLIVLLVSKPTEVEKTKVGGEVYKYHCLYQITNTINGKIYIGRHSTNDVNDDYFGSGVILKQAIAKHGIKNFKKEILFTFDTLKEVLEVEKKIVNCDFCMREDTYNLSEGGYGGVSHTLTPERRRSLIKNSVEVFVDGVRFDSVKAAARYFGITPPTVKDRLVSPHFQDWFSPKIEKNKPVRFRRDSDIVRLRVNKRPYKEGVFKTYDLANRRH